MFKLKSVLHCSFINAMIKLILTLVLFCCLQVIYGQEAIGLDRNFYAKSGLDSGINISVPSIEFNFSKIGKGYKDFDALLPNSTGYIIQGLLPLRVAPPPAFFCQLEHKIEVKSKLAPRFRLGSVNYTDWMEGKGEWCTRYRN